MSSTVGSEASAGPLAGRFHAFNIFALLAVVCNCFVPVNAQAFYDSTKVMTEGGLRFSRRDNDAIRMSSNAISGLRVGGSASAPGGSIKVGSASSDVQSVLNPLSEDQNGVTDSLFVAGKPSQWSSTYQLQRPLPVGNREVLSRRVSRGILDPRVVQQLNALQEQQESSNAQVIQSIQLKDLKGETLSRKVKFTDEYNNLINLLAARDNSGRLQTSGLHILSYSKSEEKPQLSHYPFAQNKLQPTQAWVQDKDSNSKQLKVLPVYIDHEDSSNRGSSVQLQNMQSSGSSQSHVKVTILGFSKNPDPRQGKTSAISAFATNNRTVGSVQVKPVVGTIQVKPGQTLGDLAALYGVTVDAILKANNLPSANVDISKLSLVIPGQTLSDLAALYGVTVDELVKANNLPSANVDIAKLSLVIPADLSTIGFETSLEGETAAMMAERFNVDTAWLMDLNGITDPGKVIATGTQVRIPGRRPVGSPILPPAKPMPPELEYADYGAYTTYEVTYNVIGSMVPLFTRTLTDSFK